MRLIGTRSIVRRLSAFGSSVTSAASIVEYFAVASSAIESVGYDPQAMTLAIAFTNGREYHYYGVPPDVIDQLRIAPSAGRFVNEHIKTAGYAYARIR